MGLPIKGESTATGTPVVIGTELVVGAAEVGAVVMVLAEKGTLLPVVQPVVLPVDAAGWFVGVVIVDRH